MANVSLKYSLLNKTAKKEINDFMDFLLSKQKQNKKNPLSAYKKKILKVSSWDNEDIKVFNENRKLFNQWKIQDW